MWIDKTTKANPIFREPDIDLNYKAQRGCFVMKSRVKNYVKIMLHQNFNLGAI